MKTRAFDPIENRWRTDYVVTPDGEISMMTAGKDFFIDQSINLIRQPDWKLSRFTDFYDRESNDIWQYDIVEVRGIRAVVHFEFGRFILVSNIYPDGYIEITDLITVEGKEAWLNVKALGDIFQNPELLEEVNK